MYFRKFTVFEKNQNNVLTDIFNCIKITMFSVEGGIFMKNKVLLKLNIEMFLCEVKANVANKEMNVIKLT